MAVLPNILQHVPLEFIDGDKTYKVKMVDHDTKAAFENHFFAVNCETARAMKDMMTPEEWAMQLGIIRRQRNNGEFQLESESGAAFIATPRGAIWLIMTLFEVNHDTALDLLVRHETELSSFLETVLSESIPAIKSAIKKQAAAKAKAEAEKAAKEAAAGATDPNSQAAPPS